MFLLKLLLGKNKFMFIWSQALQRASNYTPSSFVDIIKSPLFPDYFT